MEIFIPDVCVADPYPIRKVDQNLELSCTGRGDKSMAINWKQEKLGAESLKQTSGKLRHRVFVVSEIYKRLL